MSDSELVRTQRPTLSLTRGSDLFSFSRNISSILPRAEAATTIPRQVKLRRFFAKNEVERSVDTR
jgi:hypothetical protein